jgi:hypothetical protein
MISNKTIKFPAAAIFSLLLLMSVAVTYLIATHGIKMGVTVLLVSIGVVFVAAVLKDYRIGFYFIFFMGVFMFYVDRLFTVPFPMGTVYDALVALVFFSLMVERRHHDWSSFKNPVTTMFFVLIVYQVLQLFNPSANSVLAWIVSLRNNISFLIYIICFQMFSSLKGIKKFTMVWLGIALLTGLYGIYQRVFGLPDFEHAWLYASEDRVGLLIPVGPFGFWIIHGGVGSCSNGVSYGPFQASLPRSLCGYHGHPACCHVIFGNENSDSARCGRSSILCYHHDA